jgi:hypothetical protein
LSSAGGAVSGSVAGTSSLVEPDAADDTVSELFPRESPPTSEQPANDIIMTHIAAAAAAVRLKSAISFLLNVRKPVIPHLNYITLIFILQLLIV